MISNITFGIALQKKYGKTRMQGLLINEIGAQEVLKLNLQYRACSSLAYEYSESCRKETKSL